MTTQCDQIREWLEAGNSITPLEALQQFGCMALSQRIGELKREHGLSIETEMIELPNKKRVARYSLKTHVLADMEGVA